MNWISVDERLPEVGQDVLLYQDHGDHKGYYSTQWSDEEERWYKNNCVEYWAIITPPKNKE